MKICSVGRWSEVNIFILYPVLAWHDPWVITWQTRMFNYLATHHVQINTPFTSPYIITVPLSHPRIMSCSLADIEKLGIVSEMNAAIPPPDRDCYTEMEKITLTRAFSPTPFVKPLLTPSLPPPPSTVCTFSLTIITIANKLKIFTPWMNTHAWEYSERYIYIYSPKGFSMFCGRTHTHTHTHTMMTHANLVLPLLFFRVVRRGWSFQGTYM